MKIAPQPADKRQARDSVKLHIEELVLHGFAPGDRHGIAYAVESELARLMSDGCLSGLQANSLTVGRVNGGAFKVEPGAKPPEPAGKPSGSRVDFALR